jgi:methylenetetrahydrofolate dehydrogenase (NADP+)/methenyltetrahydrofolate cyclohydrolase
MHTKIIDGRRLAADLKASVAAKVAALTYTPTLKVVLVGDDPASAIYVKNKTHAAEQVGIAAETIRLPADVSEWELIDFLDAIDDADLNDEFIDGILVQLPLPPQINPSVVLGCLDPVKDVDGFHPLNVGRLTVGQPAMMPCTPKGIMRLLEASQTPLEGAHVLVVGCGPIVGRPVCTLLTQANATVTSAHKFTRSLAAHCRQADIVIVAAGCPNLIRGEMIKPGATIIDVGINRLADGRVVGDVAYSECLGIAGAITPVPGGVGPMTVACLLENTVEAAINLRSDKGSCGLVGGRYFA